MTQVKFNSVDPDNIFTEEDDEVITKQIINKDMIMSFIIDVKEFSIKCQTDELDFDSISKEVNLFINMMLCSKYKEHIIHPLEVLPLVCNFILVYDLQIDDTFKACIPILTSFHIMREMYYNMYENASDFNDITADGVEDILYILSSESETLVKENLHKINMMMIKKTVSINLGIALIKLSKYDVYSTLNEYGVKVNWNILKYLEMNEYVDVMDVNKLVTDYECKDVTGKIILEVTPLFKHATTIYRPYYEFIVELVKNRHLDINKSWIEGDYTYTPFCKDILFSSIFYLNDTFLKTTDLEDEEISRLYIYASKLLGDDELV
jgi:hypothetical protein